MSELSEYPSIANLPPPGLARRRRLRAAGINLSVDDFTDEERAVRGFPPRITPAGAEE